MINQYFDNHVKEQFDNYSPDVPPHILENVLKRRKEKPVGLLFSIFNRRNLLILFGILLAGGSGAWFLNKKMSSSGDEKIMAVASNENDNSTKRNHFYTIDQNNTLNTTTTEQNTDEIKTVDEKKAVTPANNTVHTLLAAENNSGTAITKSNKTLPTSANITVRQPAQDGHQNKALPWSGNLLNRLLITTPNAINKQTFGLSLINRSAPNVIIPGCPVERNIAGNKKYFEVYGSYDYGFRSMSDTGSAYLQKRKESTTFSSAFSGGIRYTKVFNNGMSVRGGFNYSQINEKFSIAQGNVVQVVYIVDANGDTTGSYTTTGTRYRTTQNKYRTLDIPLMVGYEMGNERLHVNVNAGPVINLYSWQKGEVLDAKGNPTSITTGKSNSPYGFKTNAGIGFMGAVSVYYKLNDKLHLLAEPYFRYNFNQMNKEGVTFQQKYNTLGMRLGVRLDIP